MNTRMTPLLIALWLVAPVALATPPSPPRTIVTNSSGEITTTTERDDRGQRQVRSKAETAATGAQGNRRSTETKADQNTTTEQNNKKREQAKKNDTNKKQDDKRGQVGAVGTSREDASNPNANPAVDKQHPAKDQTGVMGGDAESGTGAEHWLDDDRPSEEVAAPAVENSALSAPRWGPVMQLLSGINFLLAALLIIGVLMTKHRVEQTLNRLDLKTAEMDRQVRTVQERMTPLVAALESGQEKIRQDLEAMRSGTPSQTFAALERRNDWVQQNPFGAYDNSPAAEEPSSHERSPASVSDYLARAQRSDLGVVRLQTDSVNDHVFITAPDGFYFLLRGNDGSDYAIPYHERFTTKQLYDTYFTSAYDCRSPGAGTVWVVRPASVRRQGDLWRLDERGEIEVRST